MYEYLPYIAVAVGIVFVFSLLGGKAGSAVQAALPVPVPRDSAQPIETIHAEPVKQESTQWVRSQIDGDDAADLLLHASWILARETRSDLSDRALKLSHEARKPAEVVK